MNKIKIHIRNNHWKEGFLPCDLEGEKHSTITKEEFEKELSHYPEIRDKIEYLVDWDEENYISSMKEADILLGWQFPINNIRKIAPKLKWIHVSSAGVNHLSPFDWMKDDLILTYKHTIDMYNEIITNNSDQNIKLRLPPISFGVFGYGKSAPDASDCDQPDVLFEIFVNSGVYKKYAEDHVASNQIDQIDEKAVLGIK